MAQRTLRVQPLKLTEQHQWPARMPREGTLAVELASNLLVPDKKIPLSDAQFEHVFAPNISRGADVSDNYRATFCTVRSRTFSCARLRVVWP